MTRPTGKPVLLWVHPVLVAGDAFLPTVRQVDQLTASTVRTPSFGR